MFNQGTYVKKKNADVNADEVNSKNTLRTQTFLLISKLDILNYKKNSLSLNAFIRKIRLDRCC